MGLATVATPATQEGQSSGSTDSSTLSPLDMRSTTTPLYQHARTGRCRDRSNEGEPQFILVIPPISCWPNNLGACYACGATLRWRSVYGAVVCAKCLPPASPELVAAWEGEEQ
jgi:hypothetical protein